MPPFCCCPLPPAAARAEEPPLRDLLRDGLFAEEVSRDPEAAAKQYEQLLARYSEQRDFAASALFRLAEVRRKQDRKDDAVKLYQRLLAEFPGAATEARLARENLAALGGKAPADGAPPLDDESKEIARLESLAKTAPDIILDPDTLKQAADNGWSKVVQYLLAAGSHSYGGGALEAASNRGYLEIVKQLIARDAKVPQAHATAAIQLAIQFNRYTILDFLLQQGLKPGMVPRENDQSKGNNALAYALLNGKIQCAEILLKHGIGIDETAEPVDSDSESDGTALQQVIAEGKIDAANWLLDKGAKPDIPGLYFGITPLHEAILQQSDSSLALMQRLLDAGADPNRPTADRMSASINRRISAEELANITPLEIAVFSKAVSVEKVRLLLKHGADAKSNGRLLGMMPAIQRGPSDLEIVKLLVNAGATLDEVAIKNIQQGGQSDPKGDFLFERFAIPGFANDSEVQLVVNAVGRIKSTRIAVRAGDSAPPDLGSWLLANHQTMEWPNSSELNYQWLIWRKGPDGILTKQELDFSARPAFPELKWGDVIECRITSNRSGVGYANRRGLSDGILWSLRKRIAFPITFGIDGKAREIIVRGDRVLFDPTKNEVPLKNLQQVVALLWQPGDTPEVAPKIHITRKNWPEVRLSYGSKESEKFQLQAGDVVMLEITDQVRDALSKQRSQSVSLKVDGYPYVRSFGVGFNGTTVETRIPTLIQTLVETQVPPWGPWVDLSETIKFAPWVLGEELGPFYQFTMLPHPDLAHVRIHRLQENGAEKVIEVNLTRIIAASTNQTTEDEARKADVMLQPGDEIEISLLKDKLGEPWRGFSSQEEAFFAKALSGRVQVTDGDGGMSIRDILYRIPRFIEMDGNWMPIPPETGVPSAQGGWLTNNETVVRREGRESSFVRGSYFFLRDGDEIRLTPGQRPPRPQTIPAAPQPRRVPSQ
ncbi:MAG: ankyrin repeat domain-containing protein [Luteolibacter sp.]